MKIEPVSRSNITEQVYKQMLENILNGSWSPGTKIPSENELKELFQVSRNTVRLVLNRLSILGLLETQHGEGTYVKELGPSINMNCFIPSVLLDKHDFIEIMEFRKGIEVEATRLAAGRADAQHIRALEDILVISERYRDDIETYAQADIDFHLAIAKASANRMFEKMMNIIKEILLPNLKGVIKDQGNNDSREFHPKIFHCIQNRDADRAAKFMEQHLTVVIDRFKKYQQESGR